MRKPKRKTWFLVADGSKARLFESYGPRSDWAQIKEWHDSSARTPSRDLDSSPPVRDQKRVSGMRYAVETMSGHDKAEQAFIEQCALELNDAGAEGSFDQLVIAAAPHALGHLRKSIANSIMPKCISIMNKDLTNMPGDELLNYFRENIERW